MPETNRNDRKDRVEIDRKSESGVPGGGVGRTDEVGGSGVYPASGGMAPPDAEIRTPAGWGQGDRGAAGSSDTGPSELNLSDVEIEWAEQQERAKRSSDEQVPGEGHPPP